MDVARRSGGRLILYDASSATAFTEPIAGPVSAEGVEEQYGDPLSPEELERLGRPAIAKLALRAREEGVDAWAWLPSEHGVEALWDDARRRGADLVVLPAELAEPSVLERLRGDRLDDETLPTRRRRCWSSTTTGTGSSPRRIRPARARASRPRSAGPRRLRTAGSTTVPCRVVTSACPDASSGDLPTPISASCLRSFRTSRRNSVRLSSTSISDCRSPPTAGPP